MEDRLETRARIGTFAVAFFAAAIAIALNRTQFAQHPTEGTSQTQTPTTVAGGLAFN